MIVEIVPRLEVWEVFVLLLGAASRAAVKLSLGHLRSCRWRAANPQPLPGLMLSRAVQDGMTAFLTETWHMPSATEMCLPR